MKKGTMEKASLGSGICLGQSLEGNCCTVHITVLQARVLLRKPALVHWDPSPKSTGDLLFGKRGILVGDPFIQLTFREHPLCQTPCWMLGSVQTKQICLLILWI